MDIYAKADMIREALQHFNGVSVTGDCRIVVAMAGPVRTFEVDASGISTDPKAVLWDFLQIAIFKARAEGKQLQKAETRKVLGLE